MSTKQRTRKRLSSGHAHRVATRAMRDLGWSRWRVADYLSVTPEAMRLWKIGVTVTVTVATSERIRALEALIRRSKP